MLLINRLLPLSFFLAFCFLPAYSQPYTISTVAGTDRLLDGKNASIVPLRSPHAVAADGAGNLYIADTDDNRVRKLNPSGVISTYAGTGVPGYSGDRGKAALAQVSGPIGLAVDSSGNLYIADRDNFRVRRVTLDGAINTVAGNGRQGSGGDNGPALNAQVSPLALALDNQGNLYISTFDFKIRKVDKNGVITTIAGTGTAAFFGDNGPANQAAIGLVVQLATDASGNLYLADVLNFRIRKIDASGMMSTVAGSGTSGFIFDGAQANMSVMIPDGVALDSSGNLYLSDFNRDVVRKVVLSTGTIATIAGNGSNGYSGDNDAATRAIFNEPEDLSVDSAGQLYVVDFGNKRVRKISSGIITTVAGTSNGDGGPATAAFLNSPVGLAVDGANNVVFGDLGNSVTRRFSVGGAINTFGQLKGAPSGVAVDQAGNFYVTDEEPLVLKITPGGVTSIIAGNAQDGYTGDGGPATSAMISQPTGVAVDTAGNIYFTDFINNRIRKVSMPSGTISTIAGNGKFQFSGDNGPALAAGIDPFDIAVDNRNNLYVADRSNNRIRKITPDGNISTVVGTGTPGYAGDGGVATAALIDFPTGVAVDNSGNLFVADGGNSAVRRITSGGLITTIAGNGAMTPASGDGGPAIAAQIDPRRLAVDPVGNVYVSDLANDRIRKLAPQVIAVKAMSIVSGNNQSGLTGSQLTERLVVKVIDASGAGVPGVIISFTASPSNGAIANPPQAITLPDGTVSSAITLGGVPGNVSLVASTGTINATFSLIAISPTAPVVSTGGIVSAGLSAPPVTTLAPNGIATIFGTKFAPAGTSRVVGTGDLISGKLPTNLAGVCVLFGTQRAPMFAVFPGQLNVQVPQVSGQVTVQVVNKCDTPQAESSNAITVAIQAASPEFFYFLHNGNGHNPIAAVNAVTGAYVVAPRLIPGLVFTAAQPADVLTLFATGFGSTDPSFGPGELPGIAAQVTAPVSISFGGVLLAPSDILYVGVSQNAGLYQVNLRVPDGVPEGDQALVITIGGVPSPPGAYITVTRATGAVAR